MSARNHSSPTRRVFLRRIGALAAVVATLPAVPALASRPWSGNCICGLTTRYGRSAIDLIPEEERRRVCACASGLMASGAVEGCPPGQCLAHWMVSTFAPFASSVAGIEPARLRRGAGAGGLAYAAVFSALGLCARGGCGAGPEAPASAWNAVHGAMEEELIRLLPEIRA